MRWRILSTLVSALLLYLPASCFSFTTFDHYVSKRSSALLAMTGGPSRRALLRCVLGSLTASRAAVLPVRADVERVRPKAPLEALLPAVRVKLLVDHSTSLASELVNLPKSEKERKEKLVMELKDLWLTPQNLISAANEVPRQPAQAYLNSYKSKVDRLPALAKPGALLVQNGEIRTWKLLKQQERAREDQDEFRAALNTYTHQLSFSADSYRWNGSAAERSQLIRQEQLPDVKTVIASDMGLRYLYRNEILNAIQDVRAELQYQRNASQSSKDDDDFDASDLLDLLQQAQSACNKWFGLIDEQDVQEAIAAVSSL